MIENTYLTLKKIHNVLIRNIIESIIKNPEKLQEIFFSEEMDSCFDIYSKIPEELLSDTSSADSIDFTLLTQLFSSFFDKLFEIQNEFASEIESIGAHFKINLEVCRKHIVSTYHQTIVNEERIIASKIDVVDSYIKYLNDTNKCISSLAVNYSNKRILDLSGTITGHADLSHTQQIEYIKSDINHDSVIFYMDQNSISKIMKNDRNIIRQIKSIKNKKNFLLTFSPYLFEDGIKMNAIYMNEYINCIMDVTDGLMITRNEQGLGYFTENINTLIARINHWLPATKAAEEIKVYDSIINYYSNLSLSKRKPEINKNLDDFISKIYDGDFEKANDTDRYILARLMSLGLSIKDIKAVQINYNNDNQCIDLIHKLSDFLDIIGYQTESLSQVNKIKSSYQDNEHLKHAWKANYFVTDDVKLKQRGSFIYKKLRLKTNFISYSEFASILAEQLKSNDK
ncbi:hypothetical protein [Aeromonas veronii]